MLAPNGLSLFIFVSWISCIFCQNPWDLPLWPGWKPDRSGGVRSTELTTIATTFMTTQATPESKITEVTTEAASTVMTTLVSAVVTDHPIVAGQAAGIAIGVSLSFLFVVLLFAFCYYYRKVIKLRVGNVQFQAGLDIIHAEMGENRCSIEDDEISEDIIPDDVLIHIRRPEMAYYGKGTYELTSAVKCHEA